MQQYTFISTVRTATMNSDLPSLDLPSASMDLPSIDEVKRAAESGQRITPEDVSVISQTESEMTGCGPVHGGPAGSCMGIELVV